MDSHFEQIHLQFTQPLYNLLVQSTIEGVHGTQFMLKFAVNQFAGEGKER